MFGDGGRISTVTKTGSARTQPILDRTSDTSLFPELLWWVTHRGAFATWARASVFGLDVVRNE